MIEPGRILPMYGPLLGGRHGADTAGRESLTVDEMAARLLNELGEDGRALQGLARVLTRAHQLRCAAGAADLLGRATATSGDDDLPAPALCWGSMCAGPLGEHLEDPAELSAAG